MIINVRVSLNSKKVYVEELKNNSYRVRLTSAPEKGRANTELIEVLADFFGLKKNEVGIVSGLKSRDKKVEIMVENGTF